MNLKKNIESNEEINLDEFINKVWNNKKIIFFTTLATVILMSIYILFKEPFVELYKLKTEVRPISTFEEEEYVKYNNYINNAVLTLPNFPKKFQAEVRENNVNRFVTLPFKIIDKKFLFNLFVEKLNDEKYLVELLRKFEFLKKENFEKSEDYENAILNVASSITIKFFNESLPEYNKWEIFFQTSDKSKWKKFLIFAEKNTNLEIQNYLKKSFEQQFISEMKLQEYKVEDIEIQLNNNLENDEYTSYLKDIKKILNNDKYLKRLESLFKSTPIEKGDNFYAGKIIAQSTEFEIQNKKSSNRKLFIIACLFGVMIGLFYILIFKKNPKIV